MITRLFANCPGWQKIRKRVGPKNRGKYLPSGTICMGIDMGWRIGKDIRDMEAKEEMEG